MSGPARPTPGELVLHALGLLVLSLLISGNGNVLPQLFFQRTVPEQKVLWLGVCLFAGAVASTIGVLLARGRPASRGVVLAVLGLTAVAETVLWGVESPVGYVAVMAAVQLGANYLTNRLDHATVARAGDARRGLNDGITNLARLVGMLAGPLFYTAVAEAPVARGVTLAAAGGLALVSTLALFRGLEVPSRETAVAAGSSPADRRDRLFFGYAVLLYAALYLLAANLIYILRDVVHTADPSREGGLTITVVFAAAVGGNLAATALDRRGPARTTPHVGRLLAPAVCLLVEAGALGWIDGLPAWSVVVGGGVIGFSYGFFLLEVRSFASRGAREQGKSLLLTYFNNMANLSSLLAFGSMIGLASIGRSLGVSTYGPLLSLIGLLPLGGLPLLLAATRRR